MKLKRIILELEFQRLTCISWDASGCLCAWKAIKTSIFICLSNADIPSSVRNILPYLLCLHSKLAQAFRWIIG